MVSQLLFIFMGVPPKPPTDPVDGLSCAQPPAAFDVKKNQRQKKTAGPILKNLHFSHFFHLLFIELYSPRSLFPIINSS